MGFDGGGEDGVAGDFGGGEEGIEVFGAEVAENDAISVESRFPVVTYCCCLCYGFAPASNPLVFPPGRQNYSSGAGCFLGGTVFPLLMGSPVNEY